MTASYVAGTQAGSGQSAIISSLTVTIPAGASVGDYAVVSVFGSKQTATITPPSGWTLLSGPDTIGTTCVAWLYGKSLVTGDPGSATIWTLSTSGRWLAVCGVATGVTSSGVTAAVASSTTGTTKPQLPSLGGVTVGSLLFEIIHGRVSGGTALSVGAPTSYTGDATAATAYTDSPSLGSGIGYKVASTSGGFGGERGTFNVTATDLTYLVAVPAASTSASASGSGSVSLGGTGSVTVPASGSGAVGLGGTGTGTITVPNSPGAAALPQTVPVDVRLFASDYTPAMRVPNYVSCSVTWQRLGIGTGTLVIEETDPAASLILSAHERVVPVRVKVAGQTWSGRVVTFQLGPFSAPPGARQITATLADDWAWLSAMLASQGGSSSVLTGMPQYDTQTGPIATVAAYYINAAATRLGAPVAASPPQSDTTPTVTLNARMNALPDLLTSSLDAAGVVMPVSLWLPGDAQPPGLMANLTRPTIVFWPQLPATKPWLKWSDTVGSITDGNMTGNHPKAYRVMLGLAGTDAARVYDEYTDTGLQSSLGDYGFPESYSDATDISAAGADSQARGAQAQKANAGTASASVTVQDGAPWSFGSDYVCGDVATLKIAGISIQESISRVTASDDRQNGLVFTPLVGDPSAQATSDELILRAVSDIAVQLRLLQTGS